MAAFPQYGDPDWIPGGEQLTPPDLAMFQRRARFLQDLVRSLQRNMIFNVPTNVDRFIMSTASGHPARANVVWHNADRVFRITVVELGDRFTMYFYLVNNVELGTFEMRMVVIQIEQFGMMRYIHFHSARASPYDFIRTMVAGRWVGRDRSILYPSRIRVSQNFPVDSLNQPAVREALFGSLHGALQDLDREFRNSQPATRPVFFVDPRAAGAAEG